MTKIIKQRQPDPRLAQTEKNMNAKNQKAPALIDTPGFLAEQVRYHLTAAVREMLLTRETIVGGMEQVNARNEAIAELLRAEIRKGFPEVERNMQRLEMKVSTLADAVNELRRSVVASMPKPRAKKNKRAAP